MAFEFSNRLFVYLRAYGSKINLEGNEKKSLRVLVLQTQIFSVVSAVKACGRILCYALEQL
jgi:hypothetical protein